MKYINFDGQNRWKWGCEG